MAPASKTERPLVSGRLPQNTSWTEIAMETIQGSPWLLLLSVKATLIKSIEDMLLGTFCTCYTNEKLKKNTLMQQPEFIILSQEPRWTEMLTGQNELCLQVRNN